MKSFKSTKTSVYSAIILFVSFFVLSQGVGHAELKPMSPSNQLQKKDTMVIPPGVKLIPDLNVTLNVTKSGTGLVTLSGTITNAGLGDYAMASEARIIMNLCYPPKTYAQIGVSEQIFTKGFTQLKKGASIPIHCAYQIPNFQGWNAAAAPLNAKRLFTLAAVKKDMSPYQASEDRNPNNNSKAVEISYLEKR
ncbi:MAG: hypothetical protein KKF30_13500 [Proteobacteria bacterium]|nr:hypothetical protein [Pseudomonadota bacterium]MBU4469917.1 hypothetical protein [Pseudomonadota bacterium]MCG2751603.1 hypothetical protein [Desulfobacteraceae bacterium]